MFVKGKSFCGAWTCLSGGVGLWTWVRVRLTRHIDRLPASFDKCDSPHARVMPHQCATTNTSACTEDVYSAVCETDDDPLGVEGDGSGDSRGRGRCRGL